jgi:S-adenosylmethionine:tRNA ribosyltransferase-isomerase
VVDVSAFDFSLPDELIAQEPPAERGGSRLLVLDRANGAIEHAMFTEIARYLRAGDVLVLNDTRVFPARLLGTRVPSGGAVECLLVRKLPTSNDFARPTPNADQLPTPNDCARPTPNPAAIEEPARIGDARPLGVGEAKPVGIGRSEEWEALMHPGQKLKPGAQVLFERDGVQIHGEVLARRFFGRRTVRLWSEGVPLDEAINRIGHIPLPPYIHRDDRPEDRDRYQTVYADERGSIAAPTAGLHFTEALLRDLRERGIEEVKVTLHVGYGTFKPVRVERVEDHSVDPEPFTVAPAAADALTRARGEGRRIIAVGTTTARALESLDVTPDGRVLPKTGVATVFIHPGHQFRVVQGLLTNFHLPKSSLLMLVAAFAGKDRVLAAYAQAVESRYRFYSYGDAMLSV